MKTCSQIVAIASACLLASASLLEAAIIIPGANGSDGALNITQDTVIDLSKAVTANWDANNAANAGKGVYDSNKWAVVFKYTDVTIAAGATVTFKNHASRAPVVWLVSGNVTNNGRISLDGAAPPIAPSLAEPGPGGFRGGSGYLAPGVDAGAGFGVGGGDAVASGYGGAFKGNPSLVPLIGGSGGGGWARSGVPTGTGGSGGGALLIAAANSLVNDGTITSKGGNGGYIDGAGSTGGGSGGGIRIVTHTLKGNGSIQALGGLGILPGGLGRIRIERATNEFTTEPIPDPSVVALDDGATALLWPPAGAPEVRIVKVGGKDAPADPRAAFGTIGADVVLPQTPSVDVLVETTNVEEASEVFVRGTPRSNANYTEVKATKTAKLSDNPLVVRWTAALPVNVGYAAVQVRVVRP